MPARRVSAGMPPSKRPGQGGNSICAGDHLPISRSGLFRSGREHSPMRIADPFITIIHVIGSLRIIHDFGPTAGAVVSGCCEHSSHQLNCGIAGAAMCGPGSGAILEALPTPLGSTATLFNPPAFAGPRAIPLIGTFPIAPEPAGRANPPIAPRPACPPPCPPRANEAAVGVRIMNNAIATFTEVLDMGMHL